MDDRLRENIMNHMDDLIDQTKYTELVRACKQHELLTDIMCDIIENVDPALKAKLSEDDLKREKHRRLLMKLTKRGPDAYNKLKMICSELLFDKALIVLSEPHQGDHPYIGLRRANSMNRALPRLPLENIRENAQEQNTDQIVKLEEYIEEKAEKDEKKPDQKYTVKSSERIYSERNNDGIPVYPMITQHDRGVLFLVNIIKFRNGENYRNGADADTKSLLHLYKQLNFKLYSYTDLSKDQFFKLLKELLQSDVVKRTECFKLILMTHGTVKEEKTEYVEFADNAIVKVNDIINLFYNQVSHNLIGKPKILIFPFCRGELRDKGFYNTESDGVGNSKQETTLSDLLICYASSVGSKSFRDPVDGSWYIQKHCENLARKAHESHYENILKLINTEVQNMRTDAGEMQLPNYQNFGFNSLLYFNPGRYQNDNIPRETNIKSEHD